MSKPKLALIPSGYKSGKVYSILPNDATGDFDFTRQSIGTRVRKDGLIEEAKTEGSITNLLIYSEQIDQWTQSSISTSTDQTLAPNGTNTADKIIEDTATTSHKVLQSITTTNGTPYTYSVYLKSDTRSKVRLNIFGSYAEFDTTNKSLITLSGITDYKIESLSNGWGRYSISKTANSTNTLTYVYLLNNSGSVSYTGDGASGLFVWGAMFSEGALSDYIKTEGSQETKTVETFTDVPRLDWYNSNCPSLLLEPQRTNLFQRSEEFDNSYWTKARASVTANKITAPNGELTADQFFDSTDTNSHLVYRSMSITNGVEYSFSCFMKKGTLSKGFLAFNSNDAQTVVFDLENGIVESQGVNIDSSKIENYGNDWYKCSFTHTSTATTFLYRVGTYNGGITYTGTGNDYIYIWGAQLEQASYPTSYIKTEASTVTRLKDECYGGGTADLFNDNEGVLFLNMKSFVNGGTNRFIQIHDGSYNNAITLYFTSTTNRIVARVWAGGSSVLTLNYTVDDVTQYHKYAFKYKSGDYQLWVDGTKVLTNSLTTTPTGLNQIGFLQGTAGNDFFGIVKDLRYFDNGLTDAELTELTTL